MKKEKFNVLVLNPHTNKIEPFDILPKFRNVWEDLNWDAFEKSKVKNKSTLKQWIENASKYMFWGKCEWEFLVGNWPFGSYKMKEKMKDILKKGINLDDISDNINFTNIIIEDMNKVDVYDQIEMNMDIITNILYKEFFTYKIN